MKILFIRRDNIGDLVCTTPAISAARAAFPNAQIGILVNTYNEDVVSNNPDIDVVYAYEKAKHVPEKSKFSVWINNMKILGAIRRERYDIAVGCGLYSPTLARYTFLTGAKKRIGYIKNKCERQWFYNMPLFEPKGKLHEVEKVFNLLSPLGITGTPPNLKMIAHDSDACKVKTSMDLKESEGKTIVALHISSRRTENRWPVDRFVDIGNLLNKKKGTSVLLLWSPGDENNVYHPGDDQKAEYIAKKMAVAPLIFRTARVSELVAALSLSDLVVCCDGGAMHIAAALGKPIVTIWGSTNPDIWRPWAAKHILLQNEIKRADAISVDEVLMAVEKLLC